MHVEQEETETVSFHVFGADGIHAALSGFSASLSWSPFLCGFVEDVVVWQLMIAEVSGLLYVEFEECC